MFLSTTDRKKLEIVVQLHLADRGQTTKFKMRNNLKIKKANGQFFNLYLSEEETEPFLISIILLKEELKER